MAETTGEFDLYGEHWAPDASAAERAALGAARCRHVLAARDRRRDVALDADDPIRDRALRRARDERAAGRRAVANG